MILVVEDDEDVRDMLALTLQGRHFPVVLAKNGADALAVLADRRPCLIMLDLVMPGINGHQVLARMKTDGYDSPVVVISALDTEPPDGTIAMLRKPFENPALLELATRYCTCER
ncbi:MAG TPA: response regulator [Kofleriaceae bacterium]